MSKIPVNLFQDLRTTLLRCGPFDSDAELKAIFVHPYLRPWRSTVPQAASEAGRVDLLIEHLIDKYNPDRENALVLFLRVLSERIDPGDICHFDLEHIASQLETACKVGDYRSFPQFPHCDVTKSIELEPPLTETLITPSEPPDPLKLRQNLRSLSAGLATLRTDLPGPPFESDKLAQVEQKCLNPNPDQGQALLVTEEPGGGKTIFLSLLYDRLAKQEMLVLAIRPKRYPEGSGLIQQVEDLLDQALLLGPAVLLLDSLDVLAATRVDQLQDWLRLLDRLKQRPKLTVVAACRTFEARYVSPLCDQQWSETVTIGLPSTEWIENTLRDATGIELATLPDATQELLCVPLHLSLALEIVETGGSLNNLTSLHTLYDRLLVRRKIKAEGRQTLYTLARKMMLFRTVELPTNLVPDIAQSSGAVRSGLIQIEDNVVRFKHQTARDYLLARSVVKEDQTTCEFVNEFSQSLAVQPVLRQLIGILRRQERRFLGDIYQLLTEQSIRYHVKVGVISVLASLPDPNSKEAALLVRLFRETEGRLEGHFFSRSPHPGWFPVLLDRYLRPAAVDNAFDGNSRRWALNYLAQIAASYPGDVLDIAQDLSRQIPDQPLAVFFHQVANALAPLKLPPGDQSKLADILVEMVERDFMPYSYSLVTYCRQLAGIDPIRGLKLYFDTLNRQRVEGCEGCEKFAWNRSVGTQFDKVLPWIYQQHPLEVLSACADFLESFFVVGYGERDWEEAIVDEPSRYLYIERLDEHFGTDTLFVWFRQQALSFTQSHSEQADSLIEKLQNSRWQTLEHLAYLMMLHASERYAEVLFEKATEILAERPFSRDRPLLLSTISEGFGIFDTSQRSQLVQAIVDYSCQDSSEQHYWIYAPLSVIPTDLRSVDVKNRLADMSDQFGPYEHTPQKRVGGFQRVESPVDRKSMAQMPPDELYHFLVEKRTLEESWDETENKLVGGVRELAQEVSNLLAEDLQVYSDVIVRLAQDPENSIYLEYALGKAKISPELTGWFTDLAGAIYENERLHLPLARALQKAVEVVTEAEWERLKPVCRHLLTSPDPEEDRYIESREKGYSNDALSDGINTTRGAMAEVLVRASRRFWDEDLQAWLEQLAGDHTITVRAALIYMLPYLIEPAGWDASFEIFRRAFRSDEPELVRLAPRFLRHAPREAFEGDIYPLLTAMRNSQVGVIDEVVAQFTAFYALRGWLPMDELEAILFGESVDIEVKEKAIELLVNWASSPDYVEQCLRLLTRLVDQGPDEILEQLWRVFYNLRPADLQRAREFIAALLAHPTWSRTDPLFVYLEEALIVWPVETFEVLEILLAKYDEGIAAGEPTMASFSEVPLQIVTFILQSYPDLEIRALDALDELIAMRWKGIREFLQATSSL